MKKTRKPKSKGSKTVRTRASKPKNYPVEYLGIALLAFVLLEVAILGPATATDWNNALGMFDFSSQMAETSQVFMASIEPMITMASDINTVYELAASEFIVMFDLSEDIQETALAMEGISEFYQLASIEMEKLLDFSPQYIYMPQVAGATTENCK